MLKMLAKYVHAELVQSEDYCIKAMLTRKENATISEMFHTLATEELNHAKKLLKEGNRLISDKMLKTYDVTDESKEVDYEKCKVIWDWEHELAVEKIQKIESNLKSYRGV